MTDVTKIETNGPKQIHGRMGRVDFNVYTDQAGVGKVTATCLGTNNGKVPVEIIKTATDSYHLSFQPPQADIYTFDVCYRGQQIPGSPYSVNTHSPPPPPSRCQQNQSNKARKDPSWSDGHHNL